jgi:hypothetical protein
MITLAEQIRANVIARRDVSNDDAAGDAELLRVVIVEQA